MKHSKRRIAIIASTTAAVLLGGGIAAAYWTSSGTGSATATTGTTTAVTFLNQSAPTGLYPGSAGGNVTFNVHNPSATQSVVISNVTVTVDPAFSNVNSGGDPLTPCTSADFNITSGSTNAVNLTPGASAASSNWGAFTLSMNNLGTNQDNCKNVNVPLVISAS